ncbi:hypothetical protein NYO98_19640 [Nocardioides sp. STR2]|jgi:hypothetical protein|uniref:Uncharacterized protein n=1 Tax=Nocardioides pini TaxID=2975053 RepID=A0ABT4CKH5_9ACTN|nr:hypothetical protein [Nocardioides pini]MCY4728504.1 hypothetical protein [Nocardioides pini]
MSKMDNLRAMREAKYAAAQKRSAEAPARPKAPVAPPVAPPVAQAAPPSAEAEPATGEELCGHRNMGGRTCTRERGHAAKSHRYS